MKRGRVNVLRELYSNQLFRFGYVKFNINPVMFDSHLSFEQHRAKLVQPFFFYHLKCSRKMIFYLLTL